MRRQHAWMMVGAAIAAVLTASAAPASAAPAGAARHDPTPSQQADRWLVHQFSPTGLMYDGQRKAFNVGRTIDAALEVAEFGGHDAQVQETADTLARAFLPAYTEGNGYFQADNTPTTAFYANQTAKALLFAEVAGRDVHTWGDTDLLGNLEWMVDESGTDAGRIQDRNTDDTASTFGQALAARGLAHAHSTKAPAVTAYLLTQQCAAGYFTRELGDPQSVDTCDARQGVADTEATAYTVIQLAEMARPSAAVQAAIGRARAWLEQVQKPSGAWSRLARSGVNAATTGLVVHALGDTRASERGAVWLRKHEVRDAGLCSPTLRDDRGAVGFTASAYGSERHQGITAAARDQWRFTTIDALLALRELPAPARPLAVTTAHHTVHAGQRIVARVRHAAPYSMVCVSVGGRHVAHATGAAGRATVQITVPKGQAHRPLGAVDSDGRRDEVRLTVQGR